MYGLCLLASKVTDAKSAYELFEDPPMGRVTSLAAFEIGFRKFDYDVSQPGPL